MQKQERSRPSASGFRKCSRVGPRHDVEQVDVALVRRGAVDRGRPEDRIARRLEHQGAADLRETAPAILLGHLRREHAGRLGERIQFDAQFVGRPMRRPARVLLVGDDLVDDEGLGLLGELDELLGRGEVDVHGATLAWASSARAQNCGVASFGGR